LDRKIEMEFVEDVSAEYTDTFSLKAWFC